MMVMIISHPILFHSFPPPFSLLTLRFNSGSFMPFHSILLPPKSRFGNTLKLNPKTSNGCVVRLTAHQPVASFMRQPKVWQVKHDDNDDDDNSNNTNQRPRHHHDFATAADNKNNNMSTSNLLAASALIKQIKLSLAVRVYLEVVCMIVCARQRQRELRFWMGRQRTRRRANMKLLPMGQEERIASIQFAHFCL